MYLINTLELSMRTKSRAKLSKLLIRVCSILLIATLLSSCREERAQEPKPKQNSSQEQTKASNINFQTANSGLWAAGDKAFNANIASVERLNQAIKAFLSTPNTKTLTNAQQQWLKSTIQYQKSAVFLQLAEAAPKTLASFEQLRFRLGTFPIQPGFLDAFGPYKHAGLVNDIGFSLSKESLLHQNGLTSNEEIALGFYAIEFMLFGTSKEARRPSEYLKIEALTTAQRDIGYESLAELPQNRRRKLLSLQTDILNQDAQRLTSIWPQQTKKRWSKLSAEQQLALIRTTRVSTAKLITHELEILEGKENSESPKVEHAKTSHPVMQRAITSQDRAMFFRNRIISLNTTTAFFNDQQEMLAQLDAATEVLILLQQNADDSDTAELWEQAHSALNALTQTL